MIFAKTTFAVPKDALPPNFAEKTFAYNNKIAKFVTVFFLESFPLYSITEGKEQSAWE